MKSKTHVVDMTNCPQSKENNLEKNGIKPTFKKTLKNDFFSEPRIPGFDKDSICHDP